MHLPSEVLFGMVVFGFMLLAAALPPTVLYFTGHITVHPDKIYSGSNGSMLFPGMISLAALMFGAFFVFLGSKKYFFENRSGESDTEYEPIYVNLPIFNQ
jgi:hypothetical protein